MTPSYFQELLKKVECDTLDFKRDDYDFSSGDEALAKFIKDVVSFINTIRTQTSHIIIGVEITDGRKTLVGTKNKIDESIIQEKLKDKVYPRPIFTMEEVVFDNLHFNIYTFPVRKYMAPVTTLYKMKGLKVGQIYFRRGSSNAEANSIESISIHQWITEDKEEVIDSIYKKASEMLEKNNSKNELLSVLLVNSLNLAHKLNDKSLEDFCTLELQGYEGNTENINANYRYIETITSPYSISIESAYLNMSSNDMWDYLLKQKDFYLQRTFYGNSVLKLEEALLRFKGKENSGIAILQASSKTLLPSMKSDIPLNIYIKPQTFQHVYSQIRINLSKKLIEMLAKIKN